MREEDQLEWERAASDLETASAAEILHWTAGRFADKFSLACSFGAEDMVLVDMLAKADPKSRVFYLDTHLLFDETYELSREVQQRYDLRFERCDPGLTVAEQAEQHGPRLWERDPDQCCYLRKILPLEKALSGLDAWVTGIRRDQTPERANAPVVGWDHRFQLVKVNPLARWSWEDLWDYIHGHQVPYNPLHEQGYPSIGCVPCTRAVAAGEDPRAGRWGGLDKRECGLHAHLAEETAGDQQVPGGMNFGEQPQR